MNPKLLIRARLGNPHRKTREAGCRDLIGAFLPIRTLQFETYFAIIVEVGVKAHAVPPCGLQIDQWGGVGVVLGKIHVKLEAAVGVRSVGRACDENLSTRGERPQHKSTPDNATDE